MLIDPSVAELLPQLLVLLPLAFAAGLFDAAVGGGGLILVPGLFAVLPRELPAMLMGTNKFAAVMGTAAATWRYTRQVRLDWPILLPSAGAAFCGSYLGALAIHWLPRDAVRPLVVLLLALMLLYTWRKPAFGGVDAGRALTRRDLVVGLVIGAVIGFYDGFFGPGTGSFLIFLFIRFFHFDFLRASASAKVVNLATNLAALTFFLPAKLVIFGLAVPMAIANIAGAQIGSRLALKGGSAWIRKLFLALALALLAKLVWDTVRG
ncbi:TSUP family transporter [Chitiniphilus purpureus]|uniref:Probable membrane transporter protein n=1 Tax=Chitiniphilus purpureus TaxID=2981137 RepID=A0ABY6DQR2_9NEIS|nr:TSUP family transporter [Chitiniphilus sp. CD1]UXY15426.1 TSUP family transporter [Chitiniphilus sp. CD1]